VSWSAPREREAEVLSGPYEVVQRLGEDGTLKEGEASDLTDQQLRDFYRWMLFGREFDERAIRMQRQGRLGTYLSFAGQEAAQVGSASLLEEGDWMWRTYRDNLASMVFGQRPKDLLLSYAGNGLGGSGTEGVNMPPMSLQIASQVPQAAGCAWAQKLKGEDRVTLCYFGDGATSEGDFHEGLNFASVYNAPCVFFCQNNHWAISLPVEKQMASPTIAQKAVAYGIEGVRVDGNDLLAVRAITGEAIERARAGEGPTLIEALTYRLNPHSTADDHTRYHDPEVREEWSTKRDPISRMRAFLEAREIWGEGDEERALAEIKEELDEAVEAAEATPKTTVEQLIDLTFAEPTPELLRQREIARRFAEEVG
jgi:pyruvate dehydrogenase E1 component alpha subunit